MLRRVYPCVADDRDSLRVDSDFDIHVPSEWISIKFLMTDGSDNIRQAVYLSSTSVRELHEQLGEALRRYDEGV